MSARVSFVPARRTLLIGLRGMPDFSAISASCSSMILSAGASPSRPSSADCGTLRLERWVPSSYTTSKSTNSPTIRVPGLRAMLLFLDSGSPPRVAARFARIRKKVQPPTPRSGFLRQRLSQEKLDVPGRIAIERAEHLVTEAFIKWPRLETVGLDRRSDGAARVGVGLRVLHEPPSMSCAACGFSEPHISHLQPASPELAKHSAQKIAARAAQGKVDREVVRQAGHGDVVI